MGLGLENLTKAYLWLNPLSACVGLGGKYKIIVAIINKKKDDLTLKCWGNNSLVQVNYAKKRVLDNLVNWPSMRTRFHVHTFLGGFQVGCTIVSLFPSNFLGIFFLIDDSRTHFLSCLK